MNDNPKPDFHPFYWFGAVRLNIHLVESIRPDRPDKEGGPWRVKITMNSGATHAIFARDEADARSRIAGFLRHGLAASFDPESPEADD